MSIAGGLHKAVQRAAEAGCDVVQIFTKNNNQWNCKPLSEADVQAWQQALQEHRIGAPLAHASYLINLAAPDDALWRKSLDALVVEWQRCEQLRLEGLVVHPGAFTTSTAEEGLQRIAQAVKEAISQVKPKHSRLLLENTAGQGSSLGWQIEQLAWLLRTIRSRHVGVCWDTCHALAAGYDFRTAAGLRGMVEALESHRVLEKIAAIHLNDSKKDVGSRVDRHEHIGLGCIGTDGFRRFLRHKAFKDLPMYLETPKGTDPESGEDWDCRNLRVLRELVARPRTTVA
ncbi:MAG: deoxyribonuclease IV [Planctomycetota bacterium]|nr:MAG: deoxyribonuclease IV [Planctomycetota bacterium]